MSVCLFCSVGRCRDRREKADDGMRPNVSSKTRVLPRVTHITTNCLKFFKKLNKEDGKY